MNERTSFSAVLSVKCELFWYLFESLQEEIPVQMFVQMW